MIIAIAYDYEITCSTYVVLGTVSEPIKPVICNTTSPNPMSALFLPKGFEFSGTTLKGSSDVPLGRTVVFIHVGSVYAKIELSGRAALRL